MIFNVRGFFYYLDHRMIDDAFDKNKRKAQEKLGKAIGLWEKSNWPVRTKVSCWKRLHLIITVKKRLGIAQKNWGDWY